MCCSPLEHLFNRSAVCVPLAVINPADWMSHSKRAYRKLRRAQASKAGYISKVFLDSYKSPLSIILIDDLERVIDFVRTGPRFSNTVLQTLLVLLKKVGRGEAGRQGVASLSTRQRGACVRAAPPSRVVPVGVSVALSLLWRVFVLSTYRRRPGEAGGRGAFGSSRWVPIFAVNCGRGRRRLRWVC